MKTEKHRRGSRNTKKRRTNKTMHKTLENQPLTVSRLSKTRLVIFGLIFSAIGGYALYHSFAAGPNPPQPDHVVIVVEENHSYDEIIGSSSAPYINSLASQGAVFSNSFAIRHPSQPNYLELFAGSDQGITDDSCPQTFSSANLGQELLGAGLTFDGYSETLPSAGDMVCTASGGGAGSYARKHAPWTNFTNVPSSVHLPFTNFPGNFNNLPTVSFVIPNLQNDMHTGTIQQADTWLNSNIDAYAQWAKTHNSLLIVTWDEDDKTQANQIPTIFFGQSVNPGTYSETINHYNVLRTIEDMYGLSYAGGSATATPITDIWTGSSPPDTTPPSTPTGLTQTNSSTTSISISWTASTDNIAVTGYDLYKNGVATGTTASTSATFSGLICGTSYTLAVDAFDAASNKSSQASGSFATSVCPGQPADLNGDSHVNVFDLSILISNYNTSHAIADINKDGIVDSTDLSILVANYGT